MSLGPLAARLEDQETKHHHCDIKKTKPFPCVFAMTFHCWACDVELRF